MSSHICSLQCPYHSDWKRVCARINHLFDIIIRMATNVILLYVCVCPRRWHLANYPRGRTNRKLWRQNGILATPNGFFIQVRRWAQVSMWDARRLLFYKWTGEQKNACFYPLTHFADWRSHFQAVRLLVVAERWHTNGHRFCCCCLFCCCCFFFSFFFFIHGADEDKSMKRNLQWDELVLYTFFCTHIVGISFFSSFVERLEPD